MIIYDNYFYDNFLSFFKYLFFKYLIQQERRVNIWLKSLALRNWHYFTSSEGICIHLSVASWWCCCWNKRSARSPASLSSAFLCSTSLKDPERKKCHVYDIRLLKDNRAYDKNTISLIIWYQSPAIVRCSTSRWALARKSAPTSVPLPYIALREKSQETEIRARWERSISLPLISEIFYWNYFDFRDFCESALNVERKLLAHSRFNSY